MIDGSEFVRTVPSWLRRKSWVLLLIVIAVIILGPIYYVLILIRLAPFPNPCETLQFRLIRYLELVIEMVETECPAGPLLVDNDIVEISISAVGDWRWRKELVLAYFPEAGYKTNYVAELPFLSFPEQNTLRIPATGIECILFRRTKWRDWSIEYDTNIPDCARMNPGQVTSKRSPG